MIRKSVWAIALVLTGATAVLGQTFPKQPPPVANPLGQGTEEERAACHPDVMLYCKSLVQDDDQADVFAILSCLQANRPRISQACRTVLASHGQ